MCFQVPNWPLIILVGSFFDEVSYFWNYNRLLVWIGSRHPPFEKASLILDVVEYYDLGDFCKDHIDLFVKVFIETDTSIVKNIIVDFDMIVEVVSDLYFGTLVDIFGLGLNLALSCLSTWNSSDFSMQESMCSRRGCSFYNFPYNWILHWRNLRVSNGHSHNHHHNNHIS